MALAEDYVISRCLTLISHLYSSEEMPTSISSIYNSLERMKKMYIVEARNLITFGGLNAYRAKERGLLNNSYDYYLELESLSMALGLSYKSCKESLEMVAKASLTTVYLENGSRKLTIRLKEINLVFSCFAERLDSHLIAVTKSKVKGLREEIEMERWKGK